MIAEKNLSCNATEALQERLEIRKGNGNCQPKDGIQIKESGERPDCFWDEAHKNIHNHNILGENQYISNQATILKRVW